MKVKKIKKMSLKNQKKLLLIKKNNLKMFRTMRDTGIFCSLVTLPFYFSMLQNFIINNSIYTIEDIVKLSISVSSFLGIGLGFQYISNHCLADCASLETIIELNENLKDLTYFYEISGNYNLNNENKKIGR